MEYPAISSVGKQEPDFSYEGPLKRCHCGLTAPRWTSWTNINPGMRFWACPKSRRDEDEANETLMLKSTDDSCGFFEWEDYYIRGRARNVINSLKERERTLNRENRRLRSGMHASNSRSYYMSQNVSLPDVKSVSVASTAVSERSANSTAFGKPLLKILLLLIGIIIGVIWANIR